MKNNDSFKMKIVRAFFSIKGWFITRKMSVGQYYTSKHIPNSRFMYRGGHLFYQAYAASPYPGVAITDQRKKEYKYWEIGVLNFKQG